MRENGNALESTFQLEMGSMESGLKYCNTCDPPLLNQSESIRCPAAVQNPTGLSRLTSCITPFPSSPTPPTPAKQFTESCLSPEHLLVPPGALVHVVLALGR